MRNTCKPVLSEKQTQLQQAHIHQGVRLSLDNHAVRCQCKANSGGHEVYTSLTPHPLCPLGGCEMVTNWIDNTGSAGSLQKLNEVSSRG